MTGHMRANDMRVTMEEHVRFNVFFALVLLVLFNQAHADLHGPVFLGMADSLTSVENTNPIPKPECRSSIVLTAERSVCCPP